VRLMSNPRHVASIETHGTMPEDAKERLRKSLQSCLRQTFLRLVTVLDTSEVGTSRLLTVPLTHLHTLVPGSSVQGLACGEQWAALAKSVRVREVTQRRRDVIVSGVLHYEPNLRVQALSTVVHRLAESVLLRCTECSHPLSSSWYFVHPRTGAAQVLTPSNGHAQCHRLHKRLCFFRSENRRESILDAWTRLDFCEHAKARRVCLLCHGSAFCVHGKRRYRCRECAHLVKRRKK